MRPELEHLRRVEEYLLGGVDLPPEATPLADFAAQQAVYEVLHLAGRRQLRSELQTIHQQLYSPAVGRWTWASLEAEVRLVFMRWRP